LGAFGQWRSPKDVENVETGDGDMPRRCSLSATVISLRHIASDRVSLQHAYVPGHSGHIGNELSDELAKQARRRPCNYWDRLLPTWPSHLARHPLRDWAWLALGPAKDLPTLFSLEGEAFRLQRLDSRPTRAPDVGEPQIAQPQLAQIAFTAITYNALTLRDVVKPKVSQAEIGFRITGRKEVMKQQFAQLQPLFVGFQETRLPESCVQPDLDYLVLQSSASQIGSLGVALWVSKKVPYACVGERKHFIQPGHCNVFGRSERHLAVDVDAPYLRLVVIVGHAPTLATATVAEVQSFWRQRAVEVQKRPSGSDFLLLLDSNSRVGSVPTDSVGEHQADHENKAGELFREFLRQIGGYLPSTFDLHHEGEGHTWASPAGTLHRLDFVVVPLAWSGFRMLFKSDMTTGQLHCTDVLSQVPCWDWAVDVDDHYDALAEAWRGAGACLVEERSAQPKQSYRRRILFVLSRSDRASDVTSGLSDSFSARQLDTVHRWFLELDFSEAEALFRLMHLSFYLRRFVSGDRSRYLSGLVEGVQAQDARDGGALFKAVRKAFPIARSGRRSVYQPLPAVQDESGSLVVSAADKLEVWRGHFARQEAGVKVSGDQYLEAWSSYRKPSEVPVFDLQVVPTRGEVESLMLGLNRGRAAGPDSITSELLQVHVPTTSRQLLPIMLKASLGLREPLCFRGGELYCLAKRAGAMFCCKDFRSILVSSVPGKLFHRTLRRQLAEVLAETRPPLQCGTLPGEGIETISLAGRTYQLLQDARHRPWALIFYDLQSAYYQVIREAVVPGCQDDTAILRLLHSLDLPPGALRELQQHLGCMALLPQLHASPHLVASINDLFRGTWFKMSAGAVLTLTRRGTRPGDPAADAIFALTLAALLKHVDKVLDAKGLRPSFPQVAHRHPWASVEEHTSLGCPAWADDFLQPQDGESPADLVVRVRGGVELLTARATAMGMTVSFAREKTAAIVSARLSVGLSEGVDFDEDGLPYIAVRNELLGVVHRLQLVPSYKHLGGIVVATSSPVPDLHHRHARASMVVRPLQTRLFGNQRIPLATRRLLLRSLALSRYVHSGASLILTAAYHRRIWCQQYVALQRSPCRRTAADRAVHSYEVLHAAQAFSPPLALAYARASFLRRLTQQCPCMLAQLLYDHWRVSPASSWLGQLAVDVAQVGLFVPGVLQVLPSHDPVPSLLDSFLEDPSWWQRQVRKAGKVFLQDVAQWRLHPQAPPAVDEAPVRPFSCHVCAASFALRKHLGVHLARSHNIVAPARHFSPFAYCLACHKYYGLPVRVQQHLKSSAKCLRRLASVIPPLSLAEIAEVEAEGKFLLRRQKAGHWKDLQVHRPGTVALGPLIPLRQERVPALDAAEDGVLLSDLAPKFAPDPAVVSWIDQYLSLRSTEGPRA
ncbi:unnamed protein product, partial [Symbiodinium necroappetens]